VICSFTSRRNTIQKTIAAKAKLLARMFAPARGKVKREGARSKASVVLGQT